MCVRLFADIASNGITSRSREELLGILARRREGREGDVVVGFIVRRAGAFVLEFPLISEPWLRAGDPTRTVLENCVTLAGVLFRRRVEKRGAI